MCYIYVIIVMFIYTKDVLNVMLCYIYVSYSLYNGVH